MREILYRGKTEDGKWVYGAYVSKNWYPTVEDGDDEISGVVVEESNIISYDEECLWYMVIPKTVGQYTGLTDKNGKKIFEGDIVKYTEFYKFSDDEDLEDAEEKSETVSVVRFANGKFNPLPMRRNCEDYWYSYAEDDFEVIGNIHDNKLEDFDNGN